MVTSNVVLRCSLIAVLLVSGLLFWRFHSRSIAALPSSKTFIPCPMNDAADAAAKQVRVQQQFLESNGTIAFSDVLGDRNMNFDRDGVHFVYQLPFAMLSSSSSNGSSYLLSHRVREFVKSVEATIQNKHVACVHLLTESPKEQLYVYDVYDPALHSKIRTFNLNKRMTFADAVSYANRFLPGRVVAISTSDTSAIGDAWGRLTPESMRNRLFGLSRHEKKGCAMTCDCHKHFDGCHDTFVFAAPLEGGDALLEQISFRIGGLWGSENRFLWEAKNANPSLKVSNPCKTLIMQHSHCIAAGKFRPSQDQRRINVDGKSMMPVPGHLD